MSLIYQSLKKLQSEENGTDSAQGPHTQPPRKFRLRNAIWVLLGLGLLAAAAYGSWIIVGGDSPQSPSPRTAETKAVNHSAETPRSLEDTNASLAAASANRSADRSHGSNETGSPQTEMQAVTSAKAESPRLLSFFFHRNGTRARLGLEFDQKPESPEANWDDATKTLELAFASAQAKDPESLKEQAVRQHGIDLALSSKAPLRLRLECPDLEEYSAFTLPGSEEYGPRYILALRFDRNTEANSESAEKQSGTSPSSEPEANRVTAQSEQTQEEAVEKEADQREVNRQPESTQEDTSGLMEVASNTHEQQPQGLPEDGPARIRRLLKQNRNDRATQLLRRYLRRDPDNIALRTRYADVLIAEQRYRLALQALQLENLPSVRKHSGYYARVAYSQRKLGRHESAARVYRALARNEPQEGRWWMGLGLCLERMDRTEAALGAYERALDSSGLDGEVRAFLKQRRKKLDSGGEKD